jgi:hypothetical protein
MTQAQIASNPFALMMNPEAVFAAIERSDRLARLKSHICRPLDKPMIAHADATGPDPLDTSDLVLESGEVAHFSV